MLNESLTSIISNITRRMPGKIAIEFGTEEISYASLEKESDRLASFLNDNANGSKNFFLFMNRHPAMVISFLGVIKYGGVNIPLDTGLPAKRLETIFNEIDADWVISKSLYLQQLDDIAGNIGRKLNVLVIDFPCTADNRNYSNLDIFRIGSISYERETDFAIKDDNCYIYFTSGTTGKPKGILGRESSLVHFLRWEIEEFKIDENVRVSYLSAPSFDASLRDMFIPLCVGGTLCIPEDKDIILDPERLFQWLKQRRITLVHTVPSLFRHLAEAVHPGSLCDLKLVLLAGEMLKGHDVKKFYEKFDCGAKLINMYGATEATMVSVFYTVKKSDEERANVPVGKPIYDTEILILDSNRNKCRKGDIGEIYIQSPYLTNGYYNNPQLTSGVFIMNPHGDNTMVRAYKTGDLGRILPDGNLECLGRIDNQVKIRGIRVEPGEIEHQLMKHKMIREAAVVCKQSGQSDNYLVCFYVSDSKIDAWELREALLEEIPEYAVPTCFIHLEKMPLLPNGKIDRRKLEQYNLTEYFGEKYVAPEDNIQEKLAEIWSEVLHTCRIGADDNFFELGGHSLNAAALAARVNKVFGTALKQSDIFRCPTVKKMSDCIRYAETGMYTPIIPAGDREYYPASSAQKRLYIINQSEMPNTSYNMPLLFSFLGDIDKKRLQDAFIALINRHEVLRTSFRSMNGEIVQVVHNEFSFEVGYVIRERCSLNEIVREFVQPFDLSVPPLIRVYIIRSEKRNFLLIDIHHIIADGLSVKILLEDLKKLYACEELPQLKIQYKDYTLWHNNFLRSGIVRKQEEFWINNLAGNIPVLNMPTDYRRPDKKTFKGATIKQCLSGELVKKLHDIAEKTDSTLNILLLSAYFILLAKYCGQTDIIVGSLVAGRDHYETEDMVGTFINFLPIRLKINEQHTLSEFLCHAREVIIRAYENQEYPFDLLVERVWRNTGQARNPIFDTMLIFHDEAESVRSFNIGDVHLSACELKRKESKLDFKIDVFDMGNGKLSLYLEFNSSLYKKSTMIKFLKNFCFILEQFANNPDDQRISDICLIPDLHRRQCKYIRLVTSATFVETPAEDYVKWWCRQFGLHADVEAAPYNQVFQQLIDNDSLISKNDGINLLLVRFEDWIRDDASANEEKIRKLNENYNNILCLLRGKKKAIPYIVGICPMSIYPSFDGIIYQHLRTLYARWKNELSRMPDVHVVDFRDYVDVYGIREVLDAVKDREGHLPYNEEFYALMGMLIARKICSRMNQFKVIVLDCDNTLWKGICGEDGALGVEVTAPYSGLQEFMLNCSKKGILLALCSKNNEEDVWKVFETNPNMILKKEHFSCWRINWLEKSYNLKEMAKELNLSLESFIFIDESAVECDEVMKNCSEVLTLKLPDNTEYIPAFLRKLWAFDRFSITEEDTKRTEMYAAESKRKKTSDMSLDDFIRSLELKVAINEITRPQISRAAQLTQRVSQFNPFPAARTEEDIRRLLGSHGTVCHVVDVKDKYGDYGLVGVVISKRQAESLVIDTFVLSCRALGRGVEDDILSGLKKYCIENDIKTLECKYHTTSRNKPFLDFLQRTGWEKGRITEDFTEYRISIDKIRDRKGISELYYYCSFSKDNVKDEDMDNNLCLLDHIGVAVRDINSARQRYRDIGYFCTETVYDPLQKAYLVMCRKHGHNPIELVMHDTDTFVANQPEMPYHLCYKVKDAEVFIKGLQDKKIEYELISEAKPAVLFGNKHVTFLFIKGLGLTELLEDPDISDDGAISDAYYGDTIRIIASNPDAAVAFFRYVGYTVKSCADKKNETVVILEKRASGLIEIIISVDESSACYDFLRSGYSYICQLETNSEISACSNEYLLYRGKHEKAPAVSEPWIEKAIGNNDLLHRKHLLPIKHCNADSLVGILRNRIPLSDIKKERYVPPRNETERRLVSIWTRILDVQGIGIKDNFFRLGGHSLKAVTLVSMIYREFNRQIQLGEVFRNPTIEQLAECIAKSSEDRYLRIGRAEPMKYYPLSSEQKRLFIIDSLNGPNVNYNLPMAVYIEGPLDIDRLDRAIKEIYRRHEIFRTVFRYVDGEPVQIINEHCAYGLEYSLLAINAENDLEEEIEREIKRFVKPFDLSEGPLLRTKLLQLGKRKWILMLDMHHIAADRTSIGILVKEIMSLYNGHILEDIQIQYKDYSVWQNKQCETDEFKKKEEYWLNRFSREIPYTELPLDFPRPCRQSFEGRKVVARAGSKLTKGLKMLSFDSGTSLYMVLLAAYSVLLSKYTGLEEIITAIPVSVRVSGELENVMGMFVNTLAIWSSPRGDKSFFDFLLEIKNIMLEAYENREYQFERLVSRLKLPREAGKNPLCSTMFAMQNVKDIEELKFDGLITRPCEINHIIANFDLELTAIESEEHVDFRLVYCPALFKNETAAGLLNNYMNILSAIGTEHDGRYIKLRDIKLETIFQTYDKGISRNDMEFCL